MIRILGAALLAASFPTSAIAQVATPVVTTAQTVASADGVPIAWRAWGTGDTALVFIHGWSCDSSYWDAQLPVFAKDHRVIALDLAGHGASGLGRKSWTMQAFGEDVAAVVRKAGAKRVILIGHSMGGPVALEAARRMLKGDYPRKDIVVPLPAVDSGQLRAGKTVFPDLQDSYFNAFTDTSSTPLVTYPLQEVQTGIATRRSIDIRLPQA